MIEYAAAIIAGLAVIILIGWLIYHMLAFVFHPDPVCPHCVPPSHQPICQPICISGCRDTAHNLTGYRPETVIEISEMAAQPTIAAGRNGIPLPTAEQRVQMPDSRVSRLGTGRRDVIDSTARNMEQEKLPAGKRNQ